MAVAVIIPAHNEEVALRRCLAGLAMQTYDGPVEVIVAANGCDDETAAVAVECSRLLPPNFQLEVIQLSAAAKWRALNTADAVSASDARVYLDADIVLSPNALELLLHALMVEGPRLVQPRVAVEWKLKPYLVRAFLRVWSALPYVREQVLGLGCYAVNREGRGLWDAFPPFGADDTFVRLRFADDQKLVIGEAAMTLSFPASLRELILVRARWCGLSRAVRRAEPSLPRSERRRWAAAARFVSARPSLWLDGLIFSAIWAIAVCLSHRPGAGSNWVRASTAEIRDPSLHLESEPSALPQPQEILRL